MFYYNYVNKCNQIGKSPSAAAEDMGFQRSVVTRWSKGAVPRQATLQKIADYFDCDVSELIKEKPAAPEGDGESSKIIDFLLSLPTDVLRGILVALKAPEDVLAELDQQAQKG